MKLRRACGTQPSPIPAARLHRGERLDTERCLLPFPHTAGQLSILFPQKAKEKHHSTTNRFLLFYYSSPFSRIPLAAQPKGKEKKKAGALTLHPSSSVFPPAKEPRSDMEKIDKKRGLLLTQQILQGKSPSGLEDAKGLAELSPKLPPVTSTQRSAIQRTSYAQLTTPLKFSFLLKTILSLP